MSTNLHIKVPSALAIAALSLTGCNIATGFDNPDEVDLNRGDVGDDDDDDTSTNGDLVLRGFVRNPTGMGLEGVTVTVNDPDASEDDEPWTTLTDSSGNFQLPDLSDGETVNMRFELDGYAPTNGAYTAVDGGMNFFSHTLAPVDLDTEFDSEEGIEFTIDGTHAFEIPPGTIQYLDGTPYTGTVAIEATVWDRTTSLDEGGEFLASPGDGQGTLTDGSSHLLYTFGMFQIGMQDGQGQPLEAGPGFQMQVQVPDNSNLQDGQQVPYWSYNGQQNTWEEQDSGQIVPLEGGGQAWEFQPTQGLPARSTTGMVTGNPDHPIIVQVSAQAQGTVTNQMGQPQPGAQVRVIAEDLTYMQQTTTDANGNFSVNIPPAVGAPAGPNGRPVFFEIDYVVAGQAAIFRTDPQPAPGPNGVVTLGGASLGSMSCVRGSVLDDSGNGVAGVDVLSPYGGNATTAADGSFEMAVPKWQPSTVYAAPRESSSVGYEPMIFRPRPDANENTCPNAVTLRQYANTACAEGEVYIEGFEAEGLTVDAFDARFPNAPIFTTTVDAGSYCVNVPTEINTIVRVGAGDLAAGNACGEHGVNAPNDGPAECGGDWCQIVPSVDCGR